MRRAAVQLLMLSTVALAFGATTASAQLDQLFKKRLGLSGAGGDLPDTKIAAALKQALEVGTGHAVALTGRVDGYFANQVIKILMPERLRSLEHGLRAVGFGSQVDEFVLGMNRAAERAAPSARAIFLDAIRQMTFDDARRIFNGPDTAATEYFKGKTTDRLTHAFQPVVSSALNEVGVTRQYKQLVARAEGIPFLRAEDFDVDHYVVGKALDGLFVIVGDEERKIRKDPSARVTDLLREVFGAKSH